MAVWNVLRWATLALTVCLGTPWMSTAGSRSPHPTGTARGLGTDQDGAWHDQVTAAQGGATGVTTPVATGGCRERLAAATTACP